MFSTGTASGNGITFKYSGGWWLSIGGMSPQELYYVSETISLNSWTHIAVVRSVNTVTVYVDGVATAFSSTVNTGTISATVSGISGTNREDRCVLLMRGFIGLGG